MSIAGTRPGPCQTTRIAILSVIAVMLLVVPLHARAQERLVVFETFCRPT